MSAVLLLIVCLGLGIGVARYAKPSAELPKNLNWWVLNIALPALVLELIPRLEFDRSLLFLPASMWIIFLSAWLVFHYLGSYLRWSRQRIGGLILTAGLSNSSFVGFPLIEALRGKQVLIYAALADQLGCFLAIAIGGSVVAAVYSGSKTDYRLMAGKVLRFPPFIALLLALVVNLAHGWPTVIDEMLSRIGSTLTPLALFSVGLQLRLTFSKHTIVPLVSGLTWKLALAPLLIFLLGRALAVPHLIFGISLLQAAMAPMISAAILADQYELDPQIANMMIGIGIVLSFITVPLWNLLW